MSDPIWKRDEVQSPCIRICMIHPQERLCTGCYRTMDEIARWSRLNPQERSRIMDELPSRAPRLARRRGGRRARQAD